MCIYYTNSVKHAFLRNHSFPGWHRGKVLPHFQWSTIWGLSQLLDKLSWGLGAGILLWVLLMGQILLLFHRDYLLPHPGNMSSSVCFPHSHLSNLPGSCSSFPPESEAQDCRRWAFLLGPPAGLPQGLTLETKITDCTDPQLLRGRMSDCLACFTNIWLKLSF